MILVDFIGSRFPHHNHDPCDNISNISCIWKEMTPQFVAEGVGITSAGDQIDAAKKEVTRLKAKMQNKEDVGGGGVNYVSCSI